MAAVVFGDGKGVAVWMGVELTVSAAATVLSASALGIRASSSANVCWRPSMCRTSRRPASTRCWAKSISITSSAMRWRRATSRAPRPMNVGVCLLQLPSRTPSRQWPEVSTQPSLKEVTG